MFLDIAKIIVILMIMIEWILVLEDMVRERKGTRLVKCEKNIKYTDKKDDFTNTAMLLSPGATKKYRYIDTTSMIGDV